jgi:hypothetical protein
MDFDAQMTTLAALQHAPAHGLDLSELPLDVDKATPSLLKLALLVVGLGRSPENLLNPRHTDAEMVQVLGGHNDAIVSQYSVWAITENPALGVANLGLSLKDIDDHPANVRAWVLQLLAMEADGKKPFWEIIEHGMSDASAEARRGLALGFKETFVDVFEPMILDWIVNEPDSEVRQHLIEHIIRQAPRSPSYHEYAIELFAGEPPYSLLRQSMEACAVRTPLYPRFKAINAEIENGLFGGVTYVAEQNINIGNLLWRCCHRQRKRNEYGTHAHSGPYSTKDRGNTRRASQAGSRTARIGTGSCREAARAFPRPRSQGCSFAREDQQRHRTHWASRDARGGRTCACSLRSDTRGAHRYQLRGHWPDRPRSRA